MGSWGGGVLGTMEMLYCTALYYSNLMFKSKAVLHTFHCHSPIFFIQAPRRTRGLQNRFLVVIVCVCSLLTRLVVSRSQNLNASRPSEHLPIRGGEMSKRLGGIIGSKDKF